MITWWLDEHWVFLIFTNFEAPRRYPVWEASSCTGHLFKESNLKHLLQQITIITARKQSLGQGYIFTCICHSVNRGDLPQCMLGYTPSPCQVDPPAKETPPAKKTPLSRRPLCQGDPSAKETPLRRRPPNKETPLAKETPAKHIPPPPGPHPGGNWGGSGPGPHPRGNSGGSGPDQHPSGKFRRIRTRPPPTTTTAAGGTHPTGMHCCFYLLPLDDETMFNLQLTFTVYCAPNNRCTTH